MTKEITCPDHDQFGNDISYLKGAVNVLIAFNVLGLVVAIVVAVVK